MVRDTSLFTKVAEAAAANTRNTSAFMIDWGARIVTNKTQEGAQDRSKGNKPRKVSSSSVLLVCVAFGYFTSGKSLKHIIDHENILRS